MHVPSSCDCAGAYNGATYVPHSDNCTCEDAGGNTPVSPA